MKLMLYEGICLKYIIVLQNLLCS